MNEPKNTAMWLPKNNHKSLLGKTWEILGVFRENTDLIPELFPKIKSPDPSALDRFLNPALEDLHDPFLLHGMDTATQSILRAIEKGDRIMVFGDFDTDGITSTVLLVSTLQKLGANVSYRIPDRRRDSHGLKTYLIDEIAQCEVKLIVSCDCGINDQAEVAYARSLGMETIISDHHQPDPRRFPDQALAVINPHQTHCPYPESILAGVGVAFKIAQALAEKKLKTPNSIAEFLTPFLEIAAIGLISDCVPLVGENRILTHYGLQQMKNSHWPGLRQLLERCAIAPEQINTDTVGFYIAPRLNAASRLGDVTRAVQLFLGEEPRHFERLTYLEQCNTQRREKTQDGISLAAEQIDPTSSCQLLLDPEWETGILGLIASHYAEALYQPVIVGNIEGDMISASCRAPEGYSIIAGLRSCEEGLLTHFGGHAGAAGFRIHTDRWSLLKKTLDDHFSQQNRIIPTLRVYQITGKMLSNELIKILERLEPFGVGNPAPQFLLCGVKIDRIQTMGAEKKHLRIKAQHDNNPLDFVAFFRGEWIECIRPGDEVNIIFTLQKQYWRGRTSLQLRVLDVGLGASVEKQ
jgi:single-stranded-DNA-specific exonuclease